jgi:hypothetical protein
MNTAHLFSPAYRERVSAQVLEWASDDHRIVAAALVGSMATGSGDRWSALDLSFAVAKASPWDLFSKIGPRDSLQNSPPITFLTFPRANLFTACCYCPVASSSTSPLPPQPTSALSVQISSSSLERPPKSLTSSRRGKRICSGVPFITLSGLASASNAAACYKPSTGSVPPATTL